MTATIYCNGWTFDSVCEWLRNRPAFISRIKTDTLGNTDRRRDPD